MSNLLAQHPYLSVWAVLILALATLGTIDKAIRGRK